MRAGTLNEIIKVYSVDSRNNEYNEIIKTKELEFVTRAMIDKHDGDRIVENHEIVYTHNKTFIVRVYHNIKDNYIIEWNNKFYRVINVENDRTKQWKTINTELIND